MPVLPTVITSPKPIKTSLLRNEINVSSVRFTLNEPMLCFVLLDNVSSTVIEQVCTPLPLDVYEIRVFEVVTRLELSDLSSYLEVDSISSSKSVILILEL